jgi:hypothetical protein
MGEKRPKKLLDDLKDMRGYCKLTGETLEGILWRTGFASGCAHIVKE